MFEDFELSRFGGRKIRLLTFTRQSMVWRFTTADRNVTVGGHTYLSQKGISCSEVKDTSERKKNNVTIKVPFVTKPGEPEYPATQEFGLNWHPYPPSDRVSVAVMAYHRGDPDAEVVTEWTGRVLQPKFVRGTMLELVCSPTRAEKKGWVGGPRRAQRACDVPVYSQGLGMCNLDPDEWEIEAAVSAVDDLTLTADEFARDDGIEWPGGFAQWTRADGIVETRTIKAATGLTITLDYGSVDLGDVSSVQVWPGCPHNWQACALRGNTDNYGGCMCMPGKSAFDGTRAE